VRASPIAAASTAALMRKCDVLHTTLPSQTMITWGDSWPTWRSAAMAADRPRCPITSTRYTGTSGAAAESASTSAIAIADTPQAGLCL